MDDTPKLDQFENTFDSKEIDCFLKILFLIDLRVQFNFIASIQANKLKEIKFKTRLP